MSNYPTQSRTVACRFLTFAGWIEGSMHVASKVALVDHLNRPDPIYKLLHAKLPDQTVTQPFFALTRSSTMAVIPLDAAETPPPVDGRTIHKIVWLLHGGVVIEGLLDLHEGVRVSDHLAHRTGFVALHDCTLYVPSKDSPTRVVPRVPFLALQTDRAIGASELDEAPIIQPSSSSGQSTA